MFALTYNAVNQCSMKWSRNNWTSIFTKKWPCGHGMGVETQPLKTKRSGSKTFAVLN